MTDEVIFESIQPGAGKHIFANGRALLNKVNIANQQQVDIITALIKALQAQKDSIISTMKATQKKVSDYEEAFLKSKKEMNATDNGGSVEIIIGQN